MMTSPPTALIDRLASLEQYVRQRLDRAANRLEDNDTIDVIGLKSTVKALDAVDRLTGFRARHRDANAGRFDHITSPTMGPSLGDSRPELGGLPNLKASERGLLTARYRSWTRALKACAGQPLTDTAADGGHPGGGR